MKLKRLGVGAFALGADPGGGHVVTIVITNKGNYPTTGGTAYDLLAVGFL